MKYHKNNDRCLCKYEVYGNVSFIIYLLSLINRYWFCRLFYETFPIYISVVNTVLCESQLVYLFRKVNEHGGYVINFNNS